MKKVCVFILAASLIVILSAGSILAGNTYDPKIQERITKQQHRIDTGIASGSLTSREAEILQDNLNWVKSEETRLKADGKLNKRERERLHEMLDNNSDMIYKKKHNAIKRLN
jgi:hypothetical protein